MIVSSDSAQIQITTQTRNKARDIYLLIHSPGNM